jgi:CubicO group peptidase (beta-lactamase class C family)
VAESKSFSIEPARLAAHVIRPPHTANIISSRGREEGEPYPQIEFPVDQEYQFDAAGFAQQLDAALSNSVVGYVMQLRQNGTSIETRQRNWAKTPTGGSEDWTPDVRMHVASCSKLVTAIAMTKLLIQKNISANDFIIGYLPDYWSKGRNIEKISFRLLMTHRSGFNTGNSNSDFQTMKSVVAAGVNDPGSGNGLGDYVYANMNFGICRILMAVINGNISAGTVFPPPPTDSNDRSWDLTTIEAYAQYVRDNVFSPAGATGPTLTHPPLDALAYPFPSSGNGWDSGDLSTVSGGVGWHMSRDELLDVMGIFRRAGTIVNAAQAQTMLDNGFGIDVQLTTPLGTLYNKNGFWQNDVGCKEQSLAYFLPQDMELALLANSPVGAADQFFRDLVTNIYLANIKSTDEILPATNNAGV